MIGIEDPSILADFEGEKSNPSWKVGDRVIYLSRKLKKIKQYG